MPRTRRIVTGVVCTGLALAALLVWLRIDAFAGTRFFTIDEYQWGHATWLVSRGHMPYRDFYEHHLPLGYVVHALAIDEADGFVANALRLRTITLAYALAAAGFLGLASWRAHRSVPEVLLTLALAPAVGFGLMSAIDYRGDNWAAFLLLIVFALLEIGQRSGARWTSIAAGGLFTLAVAMTQKVVLLGGGALFVMWIATLAARTGAARHRLGALRIAHPLAFVGAAATTGAVVLAVGLWLGIVGRAFEINVLDALRHESLYPAFGVGQFLGPFLSETAISSLALVGFAAYYGLTGGTRHFWTLPLLAAGVGVGLVRAPFPYNFVLVCWLIAVAAVRGYCALVRRLADRPDAVGRLAALAPLLYWLPLAILPQQIGFVAGTSTLDGQLRLLEQIERHSGPDEVVIDSAGGALFRPDRGYYWYHGRAHVRMFPDWFEHRLVPEMRQSQALFWIRTLRFDLLPEPARRYLLTHYVPFFGDLHVLGFTTRATGPEERLAGPIEIVRGGRYFAAKVGAGDPAAAEAPGESVRIDGVPVGAAGIELSAGRHEVGIAPGSPAWRFSYLPAGSVDGPAPTEPHTRLFEYRRARRPSGRGAP